MSERKITVGRSDQADIVIDDDTVSRLHLELRQLDNGMINVKDLDSANGTFVIKSGRIKIVNEDMDPDTTIVIGENYQTTPRELISRIANKILQKEDSPFSRYIRSDDGTFKRK